MEFSQERFWAGVLRALAAGWGLTDEDAATRTAPAPALSPAPAPSPMPAVPGLVWVTLGLVTVLAVAALVRR